MKKITQIYSYIKIQPKTLIQIDQKNSDLHAAGCSNEMFGLFVIIYNNKSKKVIIFLTSLFLLVIIATFFENSLFKPRC
jgi:hypothetical protein